MRPQRLRALLLRLLHAQAAILAIEKTEALAIPASRRFTAEEITADKLNGMPCA